MPSPAVVKDIVEKSNANNARDDITGVLLFGDGRFIQVLEGPPGALERLLRVIERDSRHTHMEIICRDPIIERDFSAWGMAYVGADEALSSIPGLTSLDDVRDRMKADDLFYAMLAEGCRNSLAAA